MVIRTMTEQIINSIILSFLFPRKTTEKNLLVEYHVYGSYITHKISISEIVGRPA